MKFLITLILLYVAPISFASSVQILSNTSRAQECSEAASLAAKDFVVSIKDIDKCSQALLDENLLRRDKAATLVNRAIIFMNLSDFSAAYQDLTSAIKLSPNLGEIYVNLGNIFYLGESYEKAIEYYTLAIEKGLSEIHVAYMNRGMTYESMGNNLLALKDFKKSADISPEWKLPKDKIQALLNFENKPRSN